MIWLYLARARAGRATGLEANARGLDLSEWPGPVIALYLGRLAPAAVERAARDPDPTRQREQRCQAAFYLAQHHLLRGEAPSAVPLFREARRICPKAFIEHAGAVAELGRLAP